ncbi:MAG: ABC transporter permease [Treponema sp.]|jgi:simple sugar transport system permease protein|nr:ABC transporter permease [Treponema sp.]
MTTIIGIAVSTTPLFFASLGALLTEFAGVLGIFIEGFMNMGAFLSYFFMIKTNSVLIASCLTIVLCASAGWGLARFVAVSDANPFIVGLAVNLAADGLTSTLSYAWSGTRGVLRNTTGLDMARFLPFFAYIAIGCFAAVWFIAYRTRVGLRLRIVGASAQFAAERGFDATRFTAGAWSIAAMFAAIAGACLTFRVGAYTPGGASGRGWIALATVFLGFRRVWGTALAALFFALVERASIIAQGLNVLSGTVLLGLPSLLALVFYTLSCIVKELKKGKEGKHEV